MSCRLQLIPSSSGSAMIFWTWWYVLLLLVRNYRELRYEKYFLFVWFGFPSLILHCQMLWQYHATYSVWTLYMVSSAFGFPFPDFHLTFNLHKSGDSYSLPISWQAHRTIPREHPIEYCFLLVRSFASPLIGIIEAISKGFLAVVLPFERRAELSSPVSFLDTGLGSILFERVVPALSVLMVRNDNDNSYTYRSPALGWPMRETINCFIHR